MGRHDLARRLRSAARSRGAVAHPACTLVADILRAFDGEPGGWSHEETQATSSDAADPLTENDPWQRGIWSRSSRHGAVSPKCRILWGRLSESRHTAFLERFAMLDERCAHESRAVANELKALNEKFDTLEQEFLNATTDDDEPEESEDYMDLAQTVDDID